MMMNEDLLQKTCRESDLYQTPELNDVLYCNFRGIESIGGLARYTALRALFLEGNALHSLSGLPFCDLTCLYVQNNRITELEPLCNVPRLKILNISSNQLRSLQGIEACPALHTLICSGNKLASPLSIAPIEQCSELSTLDIQDNELEDTEIASVLFTLEKLCSLYVKGNGFTQNIRSFRKTMVARLPELTYLDDRPIFPLERQAAEAWLNGGSEAEMAARQKAVAEKQAAEQENTAVLQAMRAQSFQRRREALGLPPGTTDPFFDSLEVQNQDDCLGLKHVELELEDLNFSDSAAPASEVEVQVEALELNRDETCPSPGDYRDLVVKGTAVRNNIPLGAKFVGSDTRVESE